MSDKQQRLVLSIIDFLNESIENGTVKKDDQESLEVAIQCIGEAFGVDPSDEKQVDRLSVKPATLPTIFDVFLKTRDKIGGGSQASTSTQSSAQAGPSQADKAKADELKQKGNTLMSSKKYDEAIEAYTQAIAFDATNPVYFSNRAAAHSSKGDHLSAVADAGQAIEIDPAFTKAYHRLGHAHYSLGDYSAAASAFKKGLDRDPSNANLKTGLSNAEARVALTPTAETTPATSPGATGAGGPNMADMLRGLGGGGEAGAAGGGMPDLASLMQNPMMMQMAQSMMANGGLNRMMENPALANMMNNLQSGGQLPDMSELLGNPDIQRLASQFGGAGRGAGV